MWAQIASPAAIDAVVAPEEVAAAAVASAVAVAVAAAAVAEEPSWAACEIAAAG